MCELFGVNAANKMQVNELLKELYSHGVGHPHGWGMAIFYGNAASVEKEPQQADKSAYLMERLNSKIAVKSMLAHIRRATIGSQEYENCHPFVKRDNYDRCWTLVHNGTMFDCPVLSTYLYEQEGSTDSERLLCYFVDQIDKIQEEQGQAMTAKERCELLNQLICDIAPGNKMNLLFYDGELMYAHTNYADSLYISQQKEGVLLSTVPMGHYRWKPFPFTTLCAFKEGKLLYTGTNHGHEYRDNEKDLHFLFLDSAML